MTREMICRDEALAELDRHAKGETVIGGQTFRTIQLGKAATAIAALPAVQLGVQGIVWTAVKEHHHKGECVLGSVEVKHYPGLSGWRIQMPTTFGHIGNEEHFPTLEAAKLTLDGMLDARIRSALTVQVAPDVEALVKAVTREIYARQAYEACPEDRGGKNGPKGRALAAWMDARADVIASLAALEGRADG